MMRALSSNVSFRFSRASLVVGLSALVVFIPVFMFLGYLVHKVIWADEILKKDEPQLARLLGLRDAALLARQGRAGAESALSALAYSSSVPSERVGTELQQRLRSAAGSAGVAVSGSQVINGKEENGFEQIIVAMNFESSHEQLQQLLQAVALQTPAVYVDGLILVPLRGRVAGRLIVQARFCVLRQTQ